MTAVKVILGVSQRDFYNHKVFDKVASSKGLDLQVFRDAKGIEYLGVSVPLDERGRASLDAIEVSYQKFKKEAFGGLIKINPRLFQVGGV